MLQTRFESIGTYVPVTELSTEELLGRLSTARTLDLERITGIGKRRVYNSAPEAYEDSYVLAMSAILDCLDSSKYVASDLDAVISVSITRTKGGGSFCFEPSFALMLRNAIGATNALHFDLSNACAGMATGVLVLDRLIRAGVVKNGIVVSGEQITPISETAVREISEPYDPQFAALTVGDAGAAVILDGEGDEFDALHYVEIMTGSAGAEYCLGMPSDKTHGVAMYTDNKSMHSEDRYLQGIARIKDFLEETGRSWESEEYDFWIHHQFSEPAIDYIVKLSERELGTVPPHLNVLNDFGNTASTSHFLTLHEHLKRGTIPKGSKVLLIPAASGIVSGYLAATISNLGN